METTQEQQPEGSQQFEPPASERPDTVPVDVSPDALVTDGLAAVGPYLTTRIGEVSKDVAGALATRRATAQAAARRDFVVSGPRFSGGNGRRGGGAPRSLSPEEEDDAS